MYGLKKHSENVQQLSIMFANNLAINKEDIEDLAIAAKYHDIGKTRIKSSILNKKGMLTEREKEIMSFHTIFGYEILKERGYNENILNAVLYHHERIDGNGYRSKLRGNEIPFLSKVISIVDSFDAMISYRVYSHSKSIDEALQELSINRGTQFDELLVDRFIEFMNLYYMRIPKVNLFTNQK